MNGVTMYHLRGFLFKNMLPDVGGGQATALYRVDLFHLKTSQGKREVLCCILM